MSRTTEARKRRALARSRFWREFREGLAERVPTVSDLLVIVGAGTIGYGGFLLHPGLGWALWGAFTLLLGWTLGLERKE